MKATSARSKRKNIMQQNLNFWWSVARTSSTGAGRARTWPMLDHPVVVQPPVFCMRKG